MGISLQQFAAVAGVHFLALLSPGPDFFLVVRSALLRGWRKTNVVCFGIALANGVFIALAIGGFAALRRHGTPFVIIEAAGCGYLIYLGVLFLRHAGKSPLTRGSSGSDEMDSRIGAAAQTGWPLRFASGFMSAILNPKNALFYVSLFSVLAGRQATFGVQLVYGVWMFGAVLAWDVLVAIGIGHPAVVARFERHHAAIERITGVVLLLVAIGALAMLVREHTGWL